MRLLFVSGTTIGGSGRSQRELARVLERRRHQVRFVVDDARPARATRWSYGHLSDLSVRTAGFPGNRAVIGLRDAIGRKTSTVEVDGLQHEANALPQNALAHVLEAYGPDVVVASSLERWAWRRVHEVCSRYRVATVLYVREDDSLGHLETEARPDALVANAESLRSAFIQRGLACTFIPSVVDVSITQTQSSRRVALAINPVRSRGGDLVWSIAARLPDIPFVVQESWPLSAPELEEVRRHVSALSNVEFRRARPPGPGLYADARVLLVPYRVDNRPRVLLEAQANGIPAVVGDVPALVEGVGPGGLTVPIESVDAWVDAIDALWTDPVRYEALSSAALVHSRRPEVDPDAVADQFEQVLEVAIGARGR